MSNTEWREHALCKDEPYETFFEPGLERVAKAICSGCAVSEQCLTYAIETATWNGVYGGLNPDERRKFAKKNRMVRHGTLTGYTTDGCRCEKCKGEMTEYDREHRPRRRATA